MSVTVARIAEIAEITVLGNWYSALSEKAKHFQVPAVSFLRLNTEYQVQFHQSFDSGFSAIFGTYGDFGNLPGYLSACFH